MDKLAFIVLMYVLILGIGLIAAKRKLKKMDNQEEKDDKEEEESK